MGAKIFKTTLFFLEKRLQEFRRCQDLTEFAKTLMLKSLNFFNIYIYIYFFKKKQRYFKNLDRI